MTPSAPALLGSLRRRRRVHADACSTTWEAWDTHTGERLLLRIFRSGEAPAPLPALPLPVSLAEAEVPAVRTAPLACSLADLLPIEGGPGHPGPPHPGAVWTARLVLGVLDALVAVHATGNAHGWLGAESVVATSTGWTLAWLGPVPDAQPADDLRALGLLASAIDPFGPIGELVGGFADDPPPSAADACWLVLHACAGLLARERHGVVMRARALGKASRRARLGVLVQRLAGALPPPVVSACVCVDAAGVALRVESDGARIRGLRGLAGGPASEGFPVWGPQGLDPVGARALLRAWATREGRAEPDAPELPALMRWITAASRLRVDRRLLSTG